MFICILSAIYLFARMSSGAPVVVDDVDSWRLPSCTTMHRAIDVTYKFVKDTMAIWCEEYQVTPEEYANVTEMYLQSVESEDEGNVSDAVDGERGRKRKRTTAVPRSSKENAIIRVTRAMTRAAIDAVDSGPLPGGCVATNGDHSGCITLCDKSIILFVGEENEVVRTDVTNSLILAQLNADKQLITFKAQSATPPDVIDCLKQWFRVFQETFLHMNWVDTGFEVNEARIKGDSLSVDKVLLEVIGAIGNAEEKNKMSKALEVMKKLPSEDERLSLFRRRTVQRDMTQFLVQMVSIDKRGSAMIKSTMIGLTTKQDVTNVLWFQWSDADTQVYKTEHTMMLGAAVFDRIRPTIEAKIQKINESYVNQIPF